MTQFLSDKFSVSHSFGGDMTDIEYGIKVGTHCDKCREKFEGCKCESGDPHKSVQDDSRRQPAEKATGNLADIV